MNSGREIDGLAVALRRLVADLLSSTQRRLIETVSQASDDADHLHCAARSREEHFKQYFALQTKFTRLLGINGIGFSKNFHRLHTGSYYRCRLLRRFPRRASVAKTGGLNRAVPAASTWRNGGPVSKAGAGHGAARSIRAAGAVAVSRPAGQVKRSFLRDGGSLVGVSLARDAVGIAEASGLNLVGTLVCQRCWRRAPCGHHAGCNRRPRARRLGFRRFNLCCVEHRIYLRNGLGRQLSGLYFGNDRFRRHQSLRYLGLLNRWVRPRLDLGLYFWALGRHRYLGPQLEQRDNLIPHDGD